MKHSRSLKTAPQFLESDEESESESCEESEDESDNESSCGPYAAFMFEKQPDLQADIVIWFRSNLSIGGYGLPPNNKYNPDPSKWVYYGQQSWEEMGTPFLGFLTERDGGK